MSIQTINTDREEARGVINGINYGPYITILARNKTAVLFWAPAHSTSVNGRPLYGEASLNIVLDRFSNHHSDWKRLSIGGRLSKDVILQQAEKINEVFGEGIANQIADVFRNRTVLVDGGGEPLPLSQRRQFGVKKRVKTPITFNTHLAMDPRWIAYLLEKLEGVNDPMGCDIRDYLSKKALTSSTFQLPQEEREKFRELQEKIQANGGLRL